MKKLTILLLALALCVCLAACDGNDDTPDTNVPDTTPAVNDDTDDGASDTDEPDTASTYTVSLGSISVTVGGDADALIASLGEPLDYMEAPSCIHEGYDKVYVFDGYSISTSPAADGTQYISELSLTSDVVAIDGTLMIGSSVSQLEAKFGTDFTEEFGIRTYTLEGATVSVILDGDTVSGITVLATAK